MPPTTEVAEQGVSTCSLGNGCITRNDTIRTGLTDSFFGEHCFKMVFHRVVQGTKPNEREMVIFARY